MPSGGFMSLIRELDVKSSETKNHSHPFEGAKSPRTYQHKTTNFEYSSPIDIKRYAPKIRKNNSRTTDPYRLKDNLVELRAI